MSGYEVLGQGEQDPPTRETVVFERLFGDGTLGDNYDRALATYKSYGSNLEPEVLSALLHARDKDLVVPVLNRLETYFSENLAYHHPEIRGLVTKAFTGVNPTEVFFLDLFTHTLGLTPTTPEVT